VSPSSVSPSSDPHPASGIPDDTVNDDEGDNEDDAGGNKDNDDDGFQPVIPDRPKRRQKTRSVEVSLMGSSGGDYVQSTEKRPCSAPQSEVFDPTAGRQHSRTRICSGRRDSASSQQQ